MHFLRIGRHILESMPCRTFQIAVAFPDSLDYETEIQILPSEISSDAVGIARNVAAYHLLVIFRSYTAVRLPVRTAYVPVLDITRLVGIPHYHRH